MRKRASACNGAIKSEDASLGVSVRMLVSVLVSFSSRTCNCVWMSVVPCESQRAAKLPTLVTLALGFAFEAALGSGLDWTLDFSFALAPGHCSRGLYLAIPCARGVC